MKGKILNTEKSRKDKILNSSEIATLIQALGAGYYDDFQIDSLRYHKIIIMTDADVDGSHIRTLLLTFFYRHMPELVTNGYVYIAQPPLFRIRKNKTELYLKDEKEFDQYFVDELVSVSMLKNLEGKALKGKDLKNVLQKVIKLNYLLESASNGDNNFYLLLEQATISSFFNPQNFNDEKKSSQTLDYLLKRLNMIDSGWEANLVDMDFIFSKTKDKIKEDFVISLNSINENKYHEFNKICETIQEYFLSPSKLTLNENEIEIYTPRDLVSKGLELVKKGASVQRYKGLGEMNPDQLWETTLDPEFRSLLQVKIDDAQRADEIFEQLMGDDVDKRKIFIQSNAEKVVNLDV